MVVRIYNGSKFYYLQTTTIDMRANDCKAFFNKHDIANDVCKNLGCTNFLDYGTLK